MRFPLQMRFQNLKIHLHQLKCMGSMRCSPEPGDITRASAYPVVQWLTQNPVIRYVKDPLRMRIEHGGAKLYVIWHLLFKQKSTWP